MQLRRERILSEARRMIAELGYDALSTRALAKAAGVTQPTLYNLIGSKDEIVKSLLLETFERVSGDVMSLEREDPVEWAHASIAKVAEALDEDPHYFRAALIAGDRNIELFVDYEDGDAIHDFAVIVMSVMRAQCARYIEKGNLEGRIAASDLATALYASLRANLRDWAYGAISTKTFEHRAKCAHYLMFAADATPSVRRRLMQEYAKLGGPAAADPPE